MTALEYEIEPDHNPDRKNKNGDISGSIEVNCFGDSLTFSYGGGEITYPGTLKDLLGSKYRVNNLGIGGETTVTIAGRQGSIPMRVKAVTIPAKVNTVEIAFCGEGEEVPKPLRQGEAGVNPCFLRGIKGTLSITQSTTTSEDVKWYFTRQDSGEEVHIEEGEEVITQAALHRRNGIQDRQDISQGSVPDSLRVDDVHLNEYGYRFIGEQVYKKGCELGYWQ